MSLIAIDVHQNTSTLAFLDPATGEQGTRTIYTRRDDLARALADLTEPYVVALEACRQAPSMCKWLLELGAEIRLVDAEALHAVGKLRKAKTDAKDAELMLDLLMQDSLPECYLATPEVEERRVLSRHHRRLKQEATRHCNALRTHFTHSGLEIKIGRFDSRATREKMPQWLAQLPPMRRLAAEHSWELLQDVYSKIATAEREIKRQVRESPVARALAKLPGIGPIIAFALWAEIGEIERFEFAKQVASYAGVVPGVMRSGRSAIVQGLRSRCNKHLRHVIVLAAQCAARCKHSNKAKDDYLRIKARWGSNTGKIAAARRVLKDVFWLWRAVNAEAAVT